jgi:hypothetical protein
VSGTVVIPRAVSWRTSSACPAGRFELLALVFVSGAVRLRSGGWRVRLGYFALVRLARERGGAGGAQGGSRRPYRRVSRWKHPGVMHRTPELGSPGLMAVTSAGVP